MDTSLLKKLAPQLRSRMQGEVKARLVRLALPNSPERTQKTPELVALNRLMEEYGIQVDDHLHAFFNGEERALTAEQQEGLKHFIDRVAYTWFNRLVALRFMDLKGFNAIRVLTSASGNDDELPEIMAEALRGVCEESLTPSHIWKQVSDIINAGGTDVQSKVYRLLLGGVCMAYSESMPVIFSKDVSMESISALLLLLPDDLLSTHSVLASIREALTPDLCGDVEVIGWIYQFYNSDWKDEVNLLLKSGKKINEDDIAAVTQLFTPNWIVRYMVQNTIGRIWMLNHPDSQLIHQMEYFVPITEEEQREGRYLHLTTGPEDLKICDPACGSGHILVYAFDLLFEMYLEEGFTDTEIPALILENNLYGIEIDERAAELSAFALYMKARMVDSGFFSRGLSPHICTLEPVRWNEGELASATHLMSSMELMQPQVVKLLHQFDEVDNFGSLIRPCMPVDAIRDLSAHLGEVETAGGLLLGANATIKKIRKVLTMAEALSPCYSAIVANPPYLGAKSMNDRLKTWAKENYPNSSRDMCVMFIERGLDMLNSPQALCAMITMHTWMFILGFEAMRRNLLEHQTILSMAHLGTRAFDAIGGEVVNTTCFVLQKTSIPHFKGTYFRLTEEKDSSNAKAKLLKAMLHNTCHKGLYRVDISNFSSIPGSPIAYWMSDKFIRIFKESQTLADVADPRQGLSTTDNKRFLRQWYEVTFKNVGYEITSCEEALKSQKKWFPYNKGGEFRKWYGNQSYVVNWENNGEEIRKNVLAKYPYLKTEGFVVKNTNYYFFESVSWSDIANSTAFRIFPVGFIFDAKGMSAFGGDLAWKLSLLAYNNTKFISTSAKMINPTVSFPTGSYEKLPYAEKFWSDETEKSARRLVAIAKEDWDSYETSWNFVEFPLLFSDFKSTSIANSYAALRRYQLAQIEEMLQLEESNNIRFNTLYSLEDEIDPQIPLEQITLTCNPAYRYSGDKTEEEREALFLTDTIKELISYAVGCIFGRYSLDKQGLILANQGETLRDYLAQVPCPSFTPVEDNVVVNSEEPVPGDLYERVCEFLRVAFGTEHEAENLQFIEQTLYPKGGKKADLRNYLVNDFYADHVKMYNKLPIYQMISGAKGSFNALFYLHRYTPDTLNVTFTKLREYLDLLKAKREMAVHSMGDPETLKPAQRKILAAWDKKISDLVAFEEEKLRPLADQAPQLDLDDGINANYDKLASVLRKR